MDDKDDELKGLIIGILESQKLPSTNNLHNKISEAIIQRGINGFFLFEQEIAPKKYKPILNSLNDLLAIRVVIQNQVESVYNFNDFIEKYLIKFEITNDDDDLQSKIKESIVQKIIESLEEYKNQINFEKLSEALMIKNDSRNIESNNFNSINKFVKTFLIDLQLTTDETLISKFINIFLISLKEVIKEFENEISPKTVKEISDSISLELDFISGTQKKNNSEFIGKKKAKLNKETKNDILFELKKKIDKMPVCLEETIFSLKFYLILKLEDKETTAMTEFIDLYDDLDKNINNKLSLLDERLKLEQDHNEQLKELYDEFSSKIKFKEWNSALKLLKSILNQVRPLDIDELSFLMKKAKEAAEKINNQNIILFMGKTGSGKSTTIHFLAGSKMIKKQIEITDGKYIGHIEPEEPFSNPALNNVIASSKAESETRYINPISVNLKDIGGSVDETVIICDSPGFGDTAGVEVDIANGFGIVEAIKESKSVRPVFLFSYKMIGDRGEGIRELAHFLVNMVTNVREYINSFTFLFTKFPSEININAELLNIKEAMSKNDTVSLTKLCNNENINFSKIYSNLSRLKDAYWFNQDQKYSGQYGTMIAHVEAIIIQNLSKLCDKIIELDLDLSNYKNLEKAYTMLQEFEKTQQFEKNIPDVKNVKEKCLKKVNESVESVFQYIQKTFNLQCQSTHQLDKELERLKKMRHAFDMLHPSCLTLKRNEVKSIDEIDEKIKLKIEEIHEIDKKIGELSERSTILGNMSEESGKKKPKEKKEYLVNKGFEDSNKLDEEMQKIENEIENLKLSKKTKETEVKNLDSQIETYKAQKLTKETSAEASDYISNTNFNNIENLDKEIKHLEYEITNINSKGHKYVFNRLDLVIAENSLNYFSICCSIKALKHKSINVKSDLENYIKEYNQYIQEEVKYLLNEIEGLRADNTKLAFGYAQSLKLRMIEMENTKQYSLLNKIMGSKNILDELIGSLDRNLLTLTDQLNRDAADQKDLRSKLEIVKALSHLDSFVGGKYFNLYREYQAAVTKELKELYKKIIDCIQKFDYMNVATELLSIDEAPINENAFNHIKRSLSISINELIDTTKSMAIIIPNTLETKDINDIKENLKKLESAKKHISVKFDENSKERFKSQSYIDEETEMRLENGIDEIQKIISDKVMKYLKNIEALISTNNFYEAEEKREHLNNIRSLLGNYGINKEIIEKIDEIQKNLENVVEENVLKECTEKDINSYFLNPPKLILDKLEKVAHRNLRYSQILTKIKKAIMDRMTNTLKEAKEANPEKQHENIGALQLAINSLPTEMKDAIQVQIENLQRYIEQNETSYKQEFERVSSSFEIKTVNNFIEKCEKNGMNSMLRAMQDDIIKKSKDLKEKISYSDEDDINDLLNHFEKLFQYKSAFGKTVTEINSHFSSAEKILINKYISIASILGQIAKNEDNESILKLFQQFKAFAEFNYSKIIDNAIQATELCKIIESKIDTVCLNIAQFMSHFDEKFAYSIKEHDFEKFSYSINNIKKWNALSIQAKKFASNFEYASMKKFSLEKVRDAKDYTEIVKDASMFLKGLKQEVLNFELQNCYDKQREIFYDNYFKKLEFLKQSKELKDHIYNTVFDVDSFEKDLVPFLKKKFQMVVDSSKTIFENELFSKRDFDNFRISFDNLKCFEKRARLVDSDLKNYIHEIETNINKRLDSFQNICLKSDCKVSELAKNLVNMKIFAENLPNFNESINEKIDKILFNYSESNKVQRGIELAKLSTELEKDMNGVGLCIISEHKVFKGQAISLFNQDTQRHDITYVISKIDGDEIDTEMLRKNYDNCDKTYKKLVSDYISRFEKSDKSELFSELVRKIKMIPGQTKVKKNNQNSFVWGESTRDKIIELMSHIFALWTLKNTEYYEQMSGVEDRNTYLLTPHSGQIISILRLLGIGYYELKEKKNNLTTRIATALTDFKIVDKIENEKIICNKLQNNLVQVGAGEGKSLILAVASSILVLLGIEVTCVCYSDYLSSRDYESFKQIFETLGITQSIHYGTFNQICEKILNEQGDIRSRVVNLISNNTKQFNKSSLNESQPRVLLIDEVDVFFSDSFYGTIYTPLARLKDPSINSLTNYLWLNRNTRVNIKIMESREEFQACCRRFNGWEFLIKEAVKDMIADLDDYKHDYIVQNDKIGYKEQDGISFDVVYGYKTMFSYFSEHEMGRISETSLKNNISIGIKCGSYSYAEIPLSFDFIMGVTGTLKTLSDTERKIVQDVYNIKNETYMPSVYGDNKLQFAKEADVNIVNKDDYYFRLREQIDIKKQNRAVLVFFEKKSFLEEFYNSANVGPIKNEIQKITEEISSSPKEKEMFIKRATSCGQITFLTRAFGRGTDFVCRDRNVISNGGVHVIQTFFSEELSEEIQIQGRTARQGKDGSYSMILLNSNLEKYLGVEYLKEIEDMRNNKNTYKNLNIKRIDSFDKTYASIGKSVIEAKVEHDSGKKFIQFLNNKEIDSVKTFLRERNVGANSLADSRTMCLMDATGSMGHLLNQAKITVVTMFERASLILKEHGIPSDSFQLQFAVYRDYDCYADGLLQYSPWETKPDNLRKFMENIKPKGGGDYPEAIEIGLWHANEEFKKSGLSQVILIGDAPAKTKEAINRDRNVLNEKYWKKTPYKEMTYYINEIQLLKSNNIPIHAFYLNDGAKSNFQEIATETSGRCEFLDINSKDGSELLADVVTEEILRNVGHNKGKGDELVNAYKLKFGRTYVK